MTWSVSSTMAYSCFLENECFFGALIGFKGDLKFQAHAIATMTRSYANLGTVSQLRMCSLCRAGGPDVHMEDVKLEPDWQRPMFFDRPWQPDHVPLFAHIPFDSEIPEYLYKLDYFHSFKVGIGRDIVGSTIMWSKCFDLENDTTSIDDRLARAHAQFKLWALTEHYSPALRSFAKRFMNAPTSADSAWSNSKGSDTIILLKWLHFLLAMVLNFRPKMCNHM